ncbi:MAG: transporter [Butyrivibrio sp.]|nr:transporter [Butyrivibrio sp.]
MKKKIRIADFLQLQGAVIVYSLSTVAAKLASEHEFLSFKYILFFGLEFVILALYAVIWQQVIKKFQLSIAIANKATTLLWSMLWNFIIFSTGITPLKVVGVLIVVIGVIIMNSEATNDEHGSGLSLEEAEAAGQGNAELTGRENADKEEK